MNIRDTIGVYDAAEFADNPGSAVLGSPDPGRLGIHAAGCQT